MLTLSGKLVGIATTNYTNRTTGEITINHNAEILHKQAGRSELDTVKVDPATIGEWAKLEGKEISIEVRPYAVPKKEGGIMQGFSLADKKGLPLVLKA
jgi:hypothetical protein